MKAGSSLPSPSRKTTMSLPATAAPAAQARPYPRRSSLITTAPAARAISAVPSDEPPSTTITRPMPTCRSSVSTPAIVAASSSTGTTAAMVAS